MTDTKTNEIDLSQESEKVTSTVNDDTPTETKKKSTKKTANSGEFSEELLMKHQQMLNFMQNMMSNMEMDLKRMKLVANQLMKFDPKNPKSFEVDTPEVQKAMGTEGLKSYKEDNAEVVEGKFDGYFMIGNDQKKYPVPLNYSSKTKLVPGDILKLKIMDDGKFIYKLIQPTERKHLRATLSKTDENKFIAITDEGQTFFLNQAAVTFFKGKPGDELYIVTNKEMEGGFSAIEAIIKK